MIDPNREASELIALCDEMLCSLFEAIQKNDWVEAGRLDATFRGFADAFGDVSLWKPVFPFEDIWKTPALPHPRETKLVSQIENNETADRPRFSAPLRVS